MPPSSAISALPAERAAIAFGGRQRFESVALRLQPIGLGAPGVLGRPDGRREPSQKHRSCSKSSAAWESQAGRAVRLRRRQAR